MSDARARTDQVVGKFIVWKLKSGAVDESARTPASCRHDREERERHRRGARGAHHGVRRRALTMEDGDVTLHAIGSWDRVAVELDVENRLSGTGVPL
jgi:hypothetical protein